MYRRMHVARALILAIACAPLLTARGRAQSGRAADTTASPAKGASTARVTIVEFADFHCPACAHFVRETLPRLDAEYISTGLVRYVLIDFPIASLHPRAMKAALAAHCAGEQGRFWEMHDVLFANQGGAGRDSLAAHARAIGIDADALVACVKSKRYAAMVREGLNVGRRAGVRGTPTFFITVGEPGKAGLRAVRMIYGSEPYDTFKRALDEVLVGSDQNP